MRARRTAGQLLFLFRITVLFAPGIHVGCKADVAEPYDPPPGPPWVVFTKSNSPLPDSVIHAIHVDLHNRVWFATGNGAAYYYQRSWSVLRDSLKYLVYDNLNNAYETCTVTSIALSKDQGIWFGMKGGGIVRYDQNSQNGHIWTRFKIPTIQSNIVNSIACDLSGSTTYGEVWITSSLGVDRFIQTSEDGGEWHYLGGLPYRYSQNTVAVRNQRDNSIWIGSDGDGIAIMTFYPYLTLSRLAIPAAANARITGIAFEGESNVWFSKETGVSVVNMQSGNWVHFDHSSSGGYLPASETHAVEAGLNSQRWFGTDSGLVLLSDSTWSRFTTSNSLLPNDVVTSIKYDLRGNLWIGTRNGVAVYNPQGTRF